MKKVVLALFAVVALLVSADLAIAKQKLEKRHGCPMVTHYFSWFTTYSDVCLFDEGDAAWLRGSHEDEHKGGGKKPPV